MSNEAMLLSRNLQDFGRVKGLRVEDWAIAGEKG
jgi:predicted nucleic acid-binding protein